MNCIFNIWRRMSINALAALLCATLFLPTTYAAPVEIDTPEAHIVVMRALDSWSGDESASEDSLTSVEKHKGGFVLASEKGRRYDVLGFPLLFGFNSDAEGSAVVQGVIAELKTLNFKLAQSKDNFRVDTPIALEPEKLVDFVKYQRELYKSLVISEGNPATLHNSVSARKFFSGVLALGSVALADAKYGDLGRDVMLNTPVPGSIYQSISSGRAALTPLDLPNFDASSYKSIDVRRVIQGNNERVGQIIIFYKKDKTADAEKEALVKAIVSLTGADTTVESIKQARAEDFSKRQAIWDVCVGESKCKND